MRKSLSTHGRPLHHFAKVFLLPLLLFLWSGSAWGQTNPTAQALPYTQNFGTATFTTMPTGTAAWNGVSGTTVNTQTLAESSTPTGNATLSAASVSVTGAGSYGYNATSTTNACYYIQTSTNATNGVNQLATAITTGAGITSISVSYDIRVISSNAGIMGLVLQYRAGTSGSWTTVSGSALSYNNSSSNGGDADSAGDTDTYNFAISGLTASTAYQFRWASWKGTGTASGLGIDNLSFTAAIVSSQTGNWSNTATWVGGVVPTSSQNAVIATGHTVTMDSDTYSTRNSGTTTTVNGTLATNLTYTNSGTTTINGSFQLNNGGYAAGTAFTYAATGSGLIFNSGSVYGVGAGNAFWPTTSSPFNVTVNTGSGTKLNTTVGAVAGTLTLNGQLDATNAITVNGTLQLNSGGYVSSNTPVYGASSTLLYNTTYGVGLEWTTTGTTAGAGIPNNVTIQNSAAVTYSAGATRGMAGNLNIASGSSLTSGDVLNVKGTTTNAGTLTNNAAANLTGVVTNSGTFNSNGVSTLTTNFINTGTLNLGSDFYLAGNWTNTGGTFNPNSKGVFFNAASGTQTITNTAGEAFDYLIHNGAGLLQFANNVTVKGNAGNVLQLLAGTINLNAKSLTLSGSGGNVSITGSQILNSLTAGATFNITNGTKTIIGGNLSIPSNVTTVLNNGIDFGNNLTTIAGTLRVATGGFVSNNSPIYTSASTLEYNGVTAYGVNNEWTGNSTTAGAGVPQNVTLVSSSLSMPTTARGMAGNLNIGTGSTLNLSTTSGADLALGGNFSNSGTFTPNNRAVLFNGVDTTQTITGATTFDYVVVNKTGTLGTVTLASPIVINKDLTLTNRYLVLGAFNLTLPNKSSVTTSSATSYIIATSTGKLIRQNLDGTSDWTFPMGANTAGRYVPITIKNLSGVTEIQVSTNTTLSKSVATAANTLKTEWRLTTTNNVTANIKADWTSAEQNTGVVNPGSGDLGVYNSTVASNYLLYDVTLAQYNTEAASVSLANTGTNAIVIGNDDSIIISNDDCIGAKTVAVNGVSVSGSNTGATTSLSPVCGTVASDVWYTFTTSDAGSYKVSVVGASGVDPILNLYSGSCGTLTSLACVDATGSAGTEFITQSLNGNTTYYYRVYTLSTLYQGAFTTSVSTVPTITVNPASLAFGDVSITTDSTVKTFTAKASLLTPATGNIDLTAPTGYQLSLDGTTGWSSTLSLPYISSTLAETTIYTKLNPSTCGDFNGNITASGGGATTANVAVTGKGLIPATTATDATDITATTFTANWGAVTGATDYVIDVSTSPNFGTTSATSATEGFETGMTMSSYATGNGSFTLGTGSWSFVNAIKSTTTSNNYNSTAGGCQLQAATTASATTPSYNQIQSVKFHAKSGTAGTSLTVYKVVGGVETSVQTISLTASVSQYTVNINETSSDVKIKFVNGANVSYVDNVIIDYNTLTPSFVSPYNNYSVGNVTTKVISGLTPNTQYYYRVRAANGSCQSANSNVITATTTNTVIWNAGAWSNGTEPDSTLDGTVRSTYIVGEDASQPAFTVKNLTVESTGLLEIKADQGITVTGTITTADNKIVIDSDGSLLQTNSPLTNDNSGKIIVKRDVKMRKTDYTFWSSPVDVQPLRNTGGTTNPSTYNTGGFSAGTPNSRIFYYDEPTDYFKMTTDANFVPGKAYAIRGKDSYYSGTGTTTFTSDTFQFVGVPNNGNAMTVGIQKTKNTGTVEHGYNMIGNPYPSNLDFVSFYNFDQGGGVYNRDKITGKAWFWTNSSPTTKQDGSGYTGSNYAVLSLAGAVAATGVDSDGTTGSPIPTQYIKVGQGFIVQMRGAGTATETATLKFDNSMRSNNAGVFYNNNKSDVQKDRYWVKLVSPENISNMILVAYLPETTNAYDSDYDADLLVVGDDSFYSKLNTQKLQIQAREKFINNEDIIPLGTKYAGNGTYKITLGKREGIFGTDQKIYLKDKVTNTYTDLTSQDYTFSAIKGTDESRFEIVYKNLEVLGTNELSKSDFIVYRDGDSYVVKSSKALGKIEIYDASGRMLITSSTKENTIKINTSILSNGVYLLRAENSGDVKTKKIIK